ncbi:MAG: hypothetical protein ABIH23_26855 [bacterium]
MSERNIGMEILEGIREIKAHKAGPPSLRTHKLSQPASSGNGSASQCSVGAPEAEILKRASDGETLSI